MSNNIIIKKEYTRPAVTKTVIAPQSTILAGSIEVGTTSHDNGDALGKDNKDNDWDDWDDSPNDLPHQTNLWK